MNPFSYSRADDVTTAVREVAAGGAAKFIAGGTNLIDLMKENVERPSRLIDITRRSAICVSAGRSPISSRKIADLVQEDRPAMGRFKAPQPPL
jgi:FAD binding domain in molybdopterin dehydrogenase